MIVYSISSLLEIANNRGDCSISFPFLESFAGKYSQKVTEDRKTPLFSRTSKYNNFPVRCQWKGSSDKNSKVDKRREVSRKNHEKFQPKDEWRNINDEKDGEKMTLTKIQKVYGIKGLAIKVLNKITESNFEKQSSELLKILIENKEKMSVIIIARLMLEKIWYDKGFYKLYVNLCKKLWENDDWVSECYQVSCLEKNKLKEYFYSLHFESKNETPILKGPFKSSNEALNNAKKMANFKSVFISVCRDNFYSRHIFIEEINSSIDPNKKYKLKRQLFGTIEILGHFYEMGHLDENITHFIMLSLLHVDSNHESGVKCEEEIESLKILWDIVHNKIEKSVLSEYNNLLQSEFKKNWCLRIKFIIEDMLGTINSNKGFVTPIFKSTSWKKLSDKIQPSDVLTNNLSNPGSSKSTQSIYMISSNAVNNLNKDPTINSEITKLPLILSENKVSLDIQGTSPSEVTFDKNKVVSHINSDINEKISSNIVKISRKCDKENKEDMLKLLNILKTVSKLSKFITNLVSNIIKDSTEYGEYAENHSFTILSLLENYNASNLSFNNLSEAITLAGEDIGDLKIDAPKAPTNMSFIIGKILKGTKSGKIIININKTNIEYDDGIENKKEWNNIFKLMEKIVDKDTLTSRFEILQNSDE